MMSGGRGGWSPGQVTFVEALDGLMPGFDPEIGKMAQRILINPRKIDYHTGVLAKKVRSNQSLSPHNRVFFSTELLSPRMAHNSSTAQHFFHHPSFYISSAVTFVHGC